MSDMPNTRFFATALLIVLATAWILISYARRCYCDSCPNGYALWLRGNRQLCRECKSIHDRNALRPWRRPKWQWFMEPPGEWHLGLWKSRRAFSIRLFKWAFVRSFA